MCLVFLVEKVPGLADMVEVSLRAGLSNKLIPGWVFLMPDS